VIHSLTPLLNVADCARSAAFYVDLLGFEILDRFDEDGVLHWAWLSSGDAQLMINAQSASDPAARAARPDYRDVVLYFQADDAGALHAALRREGVEVTDLTEEMYGVVEFRLRDPDGYELAFTTPVETDEP